MGSQTLLSPDFEVLEWIRKHLLDDPDIPESFPAIVPRNNPIYEWDTYFTNLSAEEISSEKTSFGLNDKSMNDINEVRGQLDLKQHVGVKKRPRNYAAEMKRAAKNGPTMWLEKCNTSDGSLAYDGTTVRFCDSGTK